MRILNLKLCFFTSMMIILLQCEDNDGLQDSVSDCGLETSFIKDIDNIDSLGNASGSAIKMVDDCSPVSIRLLSLSTVEDDL